MGGFGDDDFSVDEMSSGEREVHPGVDRRSARRMRSLTMFDNIRATMYTTMAGLMDAGLDMPTAAAILADEYAGEKMDDASASVRRFFDAVTVILDEDAKDPKGAAVKIGETALRAFGERFVGPEEMSLLKAIPYSKAPAKLFLSIAGLIAQYERERAAGAVATFRRAVG